MKYGARYPDIAKSFMNGILKVIYHCRSNGIFHRNLKLSNVLMNTITTLHKVKVADFGLARAFITSETKLTPEVVTFNYRSPELLLGAVKYSGAIDIWSLGCMMAELVLIDNRVSTYVEAVKTPTRTLLCMENMDTMGENEDLTNNEKWYLMPDTNHETETRTYAVPNYAIFKFHCMFQGNQEHAVLDSIFRIMGTPTVEMWPGVASLLGYLANTNSYEPMNLGDLIDLESAGVDLLTKLLCLDPVKRISAKDDLDHPNFK